LKSRRALGLELRRTLLPSSPQQNASPLLVDDVAFRRRGKCCVQVESARDINNS
jgi:hypothetical protein